MCTITDLSYKPIDEVEKLLSNLYISDEERQVFDLAIRKKSITQISDKLSISERTVYRRKQSLEKKINNLLHKTNICSIL